CLLVPVCRRFLYITSSLFRRYGAVSVILFPYTTLFRSMESPKLPEKLAMLDGTPRRILCVCMFRGSVPALEREVNANNSVSDVFLKYWTGLDRKSVV